MAPSEKLRTHLRNGVVIPAHPLALTAQRQFDERRQRALTRYYIDAGAGGVAVGVHTTQFAIREHGLYRPVLSLAADAIAEWLDPSRPFVKVAGVVRPPQQAAAEAEIAASLGYDVALVSLGGLAGVSEETLVSHCRDVASVMPIMGFYLQPAVGGRVLSYAFWRAFAELENAVAIKVAPFNRYWTADVVRAVADAGREDLALYTGNDDSIVPDLVTPFPARGGSRWFDGGLLGQWAVWTHRAVQLLERAKVARTSGSIDESLLREGMALTDANAALFDAANSFAGCIAGIHEVLRRQGLLETIVCLDPRESLSPGQAEEIDRVIRSYPFLTDDEFVIANLDRWLT